MKLSDIPGDVIQALEDMYSSQSILEMKPKEMFIAYCEWHGLLTFGEQLWLTAIALKKLEDR